jgi:hypothetical protein
LFSRRPAGYLGLLVKEVRAVTDAYPESFPLSADQETDDDPEGFAQEAGVDPTMQEVDQYREMIGDRPAEEPPD